MPADRLERVLADDFAAGLADLPMAEVRVRRAQCQEVELGLSYARRLVQGRLDILQAELAHRRGGGGRSAVATLVEQLKTGSMLGDQSRPVGFGRLPTFLAPDAAAEELTQEIEEVVDHESLASLPDLSDEQVSEMAEQLTTLERSLSDRRRKVFDRIDDFQGEIVARYKSGAVSTDELLA